VILVTGAAGKTGRAVIGALVRRGAQRRRQTIRLSLGAPAEQRRHGASRAEHEENGFRGRPDTPAALLRRPPTGLAAFVGRSAGSRRA
jgi:hypothetical protein